LLRRPTGGETGPARHMQRGRPHAQGARKLPYHLLHGHPARAGEIERAARDFGACQGGELEADERVLDVDRMAQVVAAADEEKTPLAQRADELGRAWTTDAIHPGR